MRLVGDIGGTNARFAALDPDGRPGRLVRVDAAEAGDPATAIRIAARRLGGTAVEVALAVAGPVLGDDVHLTNRGWLVSRPALRRDLGLGRLVLVNDFAAIAHALPVLGPDDLRPLGPVVAGDPAAPRAVIGPGTGLGVATLVPCGDRRCVLAGEGGHVDLAPLDDEQAAVLRHLARRHGHVSLERVLSGPGLVALFHALAEVHGLVPAVLTPEQVTLPDAPAPAAAVLELFARLLGQAAGNLALTVGARGGVFVAGGIVPALGGRFAADGFRRGFEEKGRLQPWLAGVPTWLVVHPCPALPGLARVLAEPDSPEG